VNVETYRGVVQLSGFADSEDQAAKAVTAAKKVNGVRSVKNDIRVKR
jgi:hyperosmotically inducible protein